MSNLIKNPQIDCFLARYTKPATRTNQLNVIKMFVNFAFQKSINELIDFSVISDVLILKFIEFKSNAVKFSSLNAYIQVLKNFAKFLYRRKVISIDSYELISDIKKIKGRRPPAGRRLKYREVKTVKNNYVKSHKNIDKRDLAIFALGTCTGIRRGEISRIDVTDIDNSKLYICGKGSAYRIVYLNDFAKEALKDWLEVSEITRGALFRQMDRHGSVFSERLGVYGVAYAIKRIIKNLDMKYFTSHDLRRTFATTLLDNNADKFAVQRLMGHASVNTTAIYDRRGERINRQAINLLPY